MIIFRIKIYLHMLWKYAVNIWPSGRTYPALEEHIFAAEQLNISVVGEGDGGEFWTWTFSHLSRGLSRENGHPESGQQSILEE